MADQLRRASLEDGKLEYETRGDGEPVLLIHGGLIAGGFRPLMDEPALEDYRLIRYHRRGYAGSTSPEGSFSIEQQAADAVALLEHLDIERAHVVGHSFGGYIAVQTAMDTPEVVHSLVLLESGIQPPRERWAYGEETQSALERHRAGDSAGALDELAPFGSGWRQEVDRMIPGASEQADRDAEKVFEIMVQAAREWEVDEEEKAERITQPMLYVIGGESGPSAEEQRDLAQAHWPQTETFVTPDVGHALQIQNPRPIAEEIADFLDRHPM